MKRHDGPISDEVSVRILTVRTMTPGAGVDPNKVIRPSKRLKNWHRSSPLGLWLKAYARHLCDQAVGKTVDRTSLSGAARQWLATKAGVP